MGPERRHAAANSSRHFVLIAIAAAAYLAAAPLELHFMHAPVGLTRAFALLALLLALSVTAVTMDRVREERQLRRLATTDALTGLANRREYTGALERELARNSRTGHPFALVLLDLDRLKEINDRWGHRAGDRAIRRVAATLRASCRMSDTAARIGGDEFALVLPNADRATALRLLARVHVRLGERCRGEAVSVSGGVAEYPRDGATTDALVQAADVALYAAKEGDPARRVGSAAPEASRHERVASVDGAAGAPYSSAHEASNGVPRGSPAIRTERLARE